MTGTLTRPNANPILDMMREGDMGDPWGTALSWAFGVAEVLHSHGEEVPAEMGFSPSPYVATSDECPEDYPDCEVWHLLHRTNGYWVPEGYGATVAELQFAGRCLARYCDWLRAAGRDY